MTLKRGAANVGWMITVALLVTMSLVRALQLTPAQKTETLDVHNRLRRSVYPQAADMNYLTWNSVLEDLAQRAANSCIFEHNYGGPYENLGENLYQGFRTNTTEIITYFYMESLAYNYAKKSCDVVNQFRLAECGHYFQVVGSTVSEIGCAIAECGTNKYLFVCEYDKANPGGIYTAGTPCSACPSTAGYCLRGLCVNGSLAQDRQLIAQQGNASCSAVCKNCGVAVDNRSASPPVCSCACPPGVGTRDCSVGDRPSSCGPCAALGTPCLNGGLEDGDFNGTACSCRCPSNFTGPRCQLPVLAYTGAIQLKLRGGNNFCTNGQCATVPVDSTSFQQMWPTLRTALVSGINAFCKASADNFARCCPASARQTAGAVISGSLLSDADLSYVDFSLRTGSSGYLEVAVYAVPLPGNSLCASTATGRRRRRDVAGAIAAVSASVLSDSITAGNASITAGLQDIGLAVASVGDFKSVVDAMYGYGGSSVSRAAKSFGPAVQTVWLLFGLTTTTKLQLTA